MRAQGESKITEAQKLAGWQEGGGVVVKLLRAEWALIRNLDVVFSRVLYVANLRTVSSRLIYKFGFFGSDPCLWPALGCWRQSLYWLLIPLLKLLKAGCLNEVSDLRSARAWKSFPSIGHHSLPGWAFLVSDLDHHSRLGSICIKPLLDWHHNGPTCPMTCMVFRFFFYYFFSRSDAISTLPEGRIEWYPIPGQAF